MSVSQTMNLFFISLDTVCSNFSRIVASGILMSAGILVSLHPTPALAFDMSHGKIYGLVTDPYGTPLPNTVVTITNPKLGYSKTMTTNAEGRVRVSYLERSEYTASIASKSNEETVRIPVFAGYSSAVHFVVYDNSLRPYLITSQDKSAGLKLLETYVQIPPVVCDMYGNLCSNQQFGTRNLGHAVDVGVIKYIQEPKNTPK